MADIRYTIDYKEPDNVESKVPGEQIIRRSDTENAAVAISDEFPRDTDENPENYTLSPVVTVTKNETTYTKGNMKLQQVTVNENISVIKNGVFQTVKPESYPPVLSEVPREQLLRMDPEEKKTRIPTKFKQAASRVRRERSMPNRVDGEIILPPQHRRSSIPRLQKNRAPKTEEDEFEKIYGEIADTSIDVDISLLNSKVEDPDKIEDCFEEIVHEYDEGKLNPISVEPVRTTVSTEKALNVQRAKPDGSGTKTAKVTTKIPKIHEKVAEKGVRTTNANADKTKGIEKAIDKFKTAKAINVPSEKPISAEKRKSIDKFASADSDAPRKPSIKRLGKSTSIDTHTTTERVRPVEKSISIDKTANVDKPKSRIPMLKRRSEPEIEVPNNIQAPKSGPFGNRIKVQDAKSQFTKDDDGNAKKVSKIGVNKKVSVDDDGQTYHRTTNRTVDGDERKERTFENVEMKVSHKSDITPENVNDNTATASNPTVEHNTVEIAEITPAVENLEISYDYQEVTIEPCIVEIVEAPPTAPISESSENVYIQEIVEVSPAVLETTELQTKLEPAEADTPAVKLSPIKVVSMEEMEKSAEVIAKNTPKITPDELEVLKAKAQSLNQITPDVHEDSLSRKNVKRTDKHKDINGGNAQINSAEQNGNSREDIVNNIAKDKTSKTKISSKTRDDDEDTTLRGKVGRMISRLSSKDERDEPKKDVIEELPKPKSVLSKIAMFERKEPVEVKPRPKTIDIRHRLNKPTHEPADPKPKIIDAVLKSIHRKPNLNQTNNKDYNETPNEFKSLEDHNVDKSVKIEAVNVEIRPVSTIVVTNEAIFEEAPLLNEIRPKTDDNKVIIPEATNRDVIREKTPKSIEHAIKEVKLTPDTGCIELAARPEDIKANNNDIKQIESNVASNEDVVTIDHETETVLFDTAKKPETPKSPFHFEPNVNSHRIANYNVDRETPSLDYVFDRQSKFRSEFEDNSLKKSKSFAELDLGDAVKGRVHEMIVRMRSVDKLSPEKKDKISMKERPRKKSVSEKIALFEGKLSKPTTPHPTSRSHKTGQKKTEVAMSPADLQARIADLAAAKITYGRMTNMTYLVLGNDQEIPVLGVGTALLDKQLTAHIVAAAIELGYRAIDSAFIYGNEKEVGEGIRWKIEDGTVKREDLFIINKLWSTYHRQDLVEEACRQSLEVMGLDYFDLYLIHNPMSFKEDGEPIPTIAGVLQYSKHDYLEAWYGMEAAALSGLTRAIGVSNFNSVQLQRLLDRGRLKPVVNMVECHPYLSQQRLSEFCADRNVKLLCYGALGSKSTPLEYKNSTAAVIDDPLVKVMAAGLGVSPAQLLIRYQIECGHAVVVKSSKPSHLWDNLQALTFSLSEAHLDALRALNRNKRTYVFKGMGDTHKNYPFNIAF